MDRQLELYNKDLKTLGSTFLGRPVSQTFSSFFVWEKILTKYDFKRIIEFGTWKGNLSLYLLLFCLSEDAEFYSFDKEKIPSYFHRDDDILKQKVEFDNHFYLWDIFEHEEDILKIIQQEGRTILFCDDGNKEKELRLFSQHLKIGDIVGMHDWGTEVKFDRIKENLEINNLEVIFEDESNKNETMCRFFIKKT